MSRLLSLRRAFLRRFGVALRAYRSRFHSSHPLRADSASSKQSEVLCDGHYYPSGIASWRSHPDTPLAKGAVDLLEATSPQFICNHCVRTYVFGNLAARSLGRSIIDEEIAFCGALLHDLRLVPAHAVENSFEVEGADAAREFCLTHQVAPEGADRVWESIALHTSVGIASRMAAEI